MLTPPFPTACSAPQIMVPKIKMRIMDNLTSSTPSSPIRRILPFRMRASKCISSWRATLVTASFPSVVQHWRVLHLKIPKLQANRSDQAAGPLGGSTCPHGCPRLDQAHGSSLASKRPRHHSTPQNMRGDEMKRVPFLNIPLLRHGQGGFLLVYDCCSPLQTIRPADYGVLDLTSEIGAIFCSTMEVSANVECSKYFSTIGRKLWRLLLL